MIVATLDARFLFATFGIGATVADGPGIGSGKEVPVRRILGVGLALLLAACGVETAGTAATAAVAKKQEIDQGRKTMEQAASRAAASMDQSQDRLRQADK